MPNRKALACRSGLSQRAKGKDGEEPFHPAATLALRLSAVVCARRPGLRGKRHATPGSLENKLELVARQRAELARRSMRTSPLKVRAAGGRGAIATSRATLNGGSRSPRANYRAGGSASSPFAPNSLAYFYWRRRPHRRSSTYLSSGRREYLASPNSRSIFGGILASAVLVDEPCSARAACTARRQSRASESGHLTE
jgi:hypothetical protein